MQNGHELRKFKTLTLDLCCKAVEIGGFRQRLAFGEFAILELLTRRPGVLFTRNQLLDAMYGPDSGCFMDRTIDSHMKRLRKQGLTGIITHYGSGYCWEDRVIERKGKALYGQRFATPIAPPRCCDHCGAPIPGEAQC